MVILVLFMFLPDGADEMSSLGEAYHYWSLMWHILRCARRYSTHVTHSSARVSLLSDTGRLCVPARSDPEEELL